MRLLLAVLAMAFGTISHNDTLAHPQSVSPPSLLADGDFMISLSMSDGGAESPTHTSFTPLTGSPLSFSVFDGATCACGTKIAASESGSYSFTNASDIISAIIRLTGREQNATPHRSVATKSDSGVANHSLTSAAFSGGVTTKICDVVAIGFCDGANSNDVTFTQPGGYTKDLDVVQAGGSFERQYMIAHLDSVAAGFDGQLTFSVATPAGVISAVGIFVLAIADAAPAATPPRLARIMSPQQRMAA